jgi:hypothetical protein
VLAAFIDSSTLVEFCERALKTVCALSFAGAQRVTSRYHFATRTAAALHVGCRRVHHGAHSIPYYQNALADPWSTEDLDLDFASGV